jgi:hypothetical protein
MALETGTYISDLVVTNPTSTDPKSQGDDQIRLVKSVLKNTYPNVSGAVTPTHTELNYVDGVTSAIQGQIDSKGTITGQTWTGTHAFASTTSIGNVSATEISYLDGVTSAIQTQFTDITGTLIPAKGDITGQTWTGTHSFTGATITVPTQSAGDNSTKAASTAYVITQAFSTALPSQAGHAGEFVTTDGTNASWATPTSTLETISRTSNTIISSTNISKLIDITSGTFSQTIDTAANLGSSFYCYIRNSGTGDITFTPTSGTIDGLASYKIYPNEVRLVISDGSTIKTMVLVSFNKAWTSSDTFTKPPGYSGISYGILSGGSGGGGGGGGGSSAANAGGGGGGGASGNCASIITGIVSTRYLAATGSIVVGAGGAGGTAGTLGVSGGIGSAGTASSFYSITGSTTTPTTTQRGVNGASAGAGGAGGAGGTVGKTDASGTGISAVIYTQKNTNEGAGTAGGAAVGTTGGTGGAGRVGASTEFLNPSTGGTGGAGVAGAATGNAGAAAPANTGAGGGGGSGAGGQSTGGIGTGLAGAGGAGGSGIVILQGVI